MQSTQQHQQEQQQRNGFPSTHLSTTSPLTLNTTPHTPHAMPALMAACPPHLRLSAPAFERVRLKGMGHILQGMPGVEAVVLVVKKVRRVRHPGHTPRLLRLCGGSSRRAPARRDAGRDKG